MFNDRRASSDRRKQQLPMPAGQNRRNGARRDGNFHSKPWWLKVNYSVELISAEERAEHMIEIAIEAKPQNSHDVKTNKRNK